MTPEEKDLIATPVYLCSEDENLSRKRALNEIKGVNENRSRRYKKRHIITDRIRNTENLVKKTNPRTKWKEYRKLAHFLCKHNRFNQSLEYISKCITLKLDFYEPTDPYVIQENLLYNEVLQKLKAFRKI